MTSHTPLTVIKSLCARYGVKAKKSLGQHFLIEERVLASILQSAQLKPSDIVLEIGPGLGTLTTALAPWVQKVIAIELDRNIIPALREVTHPYDNIEIVQGDVLKLPITDYLPPHTPYKLVANIPYDITGAILRTFLAPTMLPTSLTLMMQYEVATRITARQGAMSILALAVRYAGVPTLIQKVSPHAFWPMPKVSSAIVTLHPHTTPPNTPMEPLFILIKKGFSQKRKQLSTTLHDLMGVSKEGMEHILYTLNLNPRARPQDLSLEDWERLTAIYLDV